MAAQGWIKVHRSLLENWCASEPEAIAVWVRLLCEANFEDRKSNVYGQLVDVKRGQMIYGRKAFSERSGVSEMKLRRIMSLLEKDGMINQHKGSKFTVITIVCYDEYQEANQQTASKQPANNQQVTTLEEVKKLRSEEIDCVSPGGDQPESSGNGSKKKARRWGADEQVPEDWIAKAITKGLTRQAALLEAEKFANHWAAKAGKDATKLDWSRTWSTWIINAIAYGAGRSTAPQQPKQPRAFSQ